MTAELKSSNLSSYFNVIAPKAKSEMYIGSIHGNTFAGTFPANGDYCIEVI